MLLIFLHIVVYLLLRTEKGDKKDLEKRVHGPFVPVAPSRFSGCRDREQERIAKRNREAVEEIDRVYKTVGVLKKLKKM